MPALEKVAQLVHHHVLKAVGRIQGQSRVYADAARRRLATTPTTLHVAICQHASLHTQNRLPLLDDQGNARRHQGLPLSLLFGARLLGLPTRRVSSRCNASVNPRALSPHERGNEVVARAQRSRNLHAPTRRLNAKVSVFDSLACHPHLKPINHKKARLGLAARRRCSLAAECRLAASRGCRFNARRGRRYVTRWRYSPTTKRG